MSNNLPETPTRIPPDILVSLMQISAKLKTQLITDLSEKEIFLQKKQDK